MTGLLDALKLGAGAIIGGIVVLAAVMLDRYRGIYAERRSLGRKDAASSVFQHSFDTPCCSFYDGPFGLW